MDIHRDGNLIEAGVWAVMAVVLCFQGFRGDRRHRGTCLWLSVTMLVFGASDVVETRTGAWWKPWQLFGWKALCVVALLGGFMRLFKLRKHAARR
jgi:hypothetical protein